MSEEPITITRIEPCGDNYSRCLAYASARIRALGLTINMIRVIEREDRSLFVTLPYQKTWDGRHVPVLRLPADLEAQLHQACTEAVTTALNEGTI